MFYINVIFIKVKHKHNEHSIYIPPMKVRNKRSARSIRSSALSTRSTRNTEGVWTYALVQLSYSHFNCLLF